MKSRVCFNHVEIESFYCSALVLSFDKFADDPYSDLDLVLFSQMYHDTFWHKIIKMINKIISVVTL